MENMDVEDFSVKKRRRSSFFRKSSDSGESTDCKERDRVSSDCGMTTFNTVATGTTFRYSDIKNAPCSGYLQTLKTESTQWKEVFRKLKAHYQFLKSEERSEIILDWIREGSNLSDNDKQYLNSMPDYNGILAKYEKLKETVFIKNERRLKMYLLAEQTIDIAGSKLLHSKAKLIEQQMQDYPGLEQILSSFNLKDSSDSGFELDEFLPTSDEEM